MKLLRIVPVFVELIILNNSTPAEHGHPSFMSVMNFVVSNDG